MEKRTILAIALSFLVLMGFDFVYRNYLAPDEPTQIVENTENEPQAAPQQSTEAVVQNMPEPLLAVSETDTKTDGPKEIIIRGELYQAVVDSKGAVLSSWSLNNYRSSQGRQFEMIAAGEKGEKYSLPGSMIFNDPNTSAVANETMYEVTVRGEPYSGMPITVPVDVVLTLRQGDLAIQKTYSFKEDNYTVDLSATFVKGGNALQGMFLIGQDLGPIEEHISGRYTKLSAAYFNGDKVKREAAPKQEKGNISISGSIRWVGLDMHYFSAIAIPEKPISSFDIKGFETKDTTLEGDSIERSLLSLRIPVDGSLKYQLYMGPKKQSNLKAVSQYDLSGVIDYGIFSIIAHPLLSALRWIYQYVGNYGFSIILLTLLLSILLFPLRLKQMLSMKKMQVGSA